MTKSLDKQIAEAAEGVELRMATNKTKSSKAEIKTYEPTERDDVTEEFIRRADKLRGSADSDKGLQIPKEGDWSFKNGSVADNFDQHVRQQLPWYDLVTGMVAHVGRHYLHPNGKMYDIGASTGNITRCLEHEIKSRNIKAISIDYSDQMQSRWQGVGEFINADATTFDFCEFDFAVCFLVLMFLSPAQQRNLVDRLVKRINEGGCLLIIDKTEPPEGYIGTVMHRLTMAGKLANGATGDEIVAKELSLAGVQRPIIPTALLTRHNAVEIFRFGEFAGWIIGK